ncbi:MAG: hypothetical protein KDD11_08610 [Acidobacteria bacterium]|nr:hypothetical protein [Acidobacteriota bacterium]
MRRPWLVLGLLLSLGVNVGILATLALHRRPEPPPAPQATTLAPGEIPEPALRRLVERLGLEGQAASDFAQIQRGLFHALVANHRESTRVQFELRRELGSRHPDGRRLAELAERSGELFRTRQELLIDAVMKSRESLDDRQIEEYRRFLSVIGRHVDGQGPAPEALRQRFRERRLQQLRQRPGQPTP